MDIQRIIRTYQQLAVSVAVLVFCVIAFFSGILPSFKTVRDRFIALYALGKDNEQLTQKVELLNRYEEIDLKDKLSVLFSAVPGDKSLPSLFGTVEAVANETGVTIVDMSVSGGLVASASASKQSPLEKKLGSRIVPFTVTVEGSLSNMQQFIINIPLVRRLMRIREFSITFPKNNKPLTVSFLLDAFYEPYETQLGGTGALIKPLNDDELSIIDKLTKFPLMLSANSENQSVASSSTTTVKSNPFMR